jgi:hypothetical protein
MWVFAQHRKDFAGRIREDGGKEAGARRALPLGPGLQNSFRVTQCLISAEGCKFHILRSWGKLRHSIQLADR